METRRVNAPGRVGSPLTTAMSAPGGSTGGTDQCGDADPAELWGPVHPEAPGTTPDAATSTASKSGLHRTMGILPSGCRSAHESRNTVACRTNASWNLVSMSCVGAVMALASRDGTGAIVDVAVIVPPPDKP